MIKRVKVIIFIHIAVLAAALYLIWGIHVPQAQTHIMEFNTQIETNGEFTVVQGTLPTPSNPWTTSLDCTDIGEFISTVIVNDVSTVYGTLNPSQHEVKKTYRAVIDNETLPTVIDHSCGFPPGYGFGNYIMESYTGNQVTFVEDNIPPAIGYTIFVPIILIITLFFTLILF